jgi:hypothetical protein
MPLVLRSVKGSNLTANEVDGNFLFLSSSLDNFQTGSVASASYAANADLLDGLNSSVFTLTSSFQNFTSSQNILNGKYATTGSNTFVGNQTINGTLALSSSLNNFASVASSANGANVLFTQATGSYSSAFFKYTAINGSNARTGEVMSVWTGNTISYAEVNPTDIGTSNITASVSLNASNVEFNIQTTSTGWVLKSIATYM